MSVNRLATQATNHCLTGCGIGEVLGLVLATWWGWGDAASIALAIVLAFFFGYLLTLVPLLRSGLALAAAVGIALAADTLSIATMEVVDNAVLLLWPGAMDAGLGDALFWIPLAIALAVAWGPTFLVNRALIARGKGHARARTLITCISCLRRSRYQTQDCAVPPQHGGLCFRATGIRASGFRSCAQLALVVVAEVLRATLFVVAVLMRVVSRPDGNERRCWQGLRHLLGHVLVALDVSLFHAQSASFESIWRLYPREDGVKRGSNQRPVAD